MTGPEPTGRTTDGSGGGSTPTVAAVVGLIAVLVLLAPVVLAGEPPTFVQLMLLPVVAVIVGVVMRRQPGTASRTVGAIVIGLGLLGALALVVLMWALLNGLGRPV